MSHYGYGLAHARAAAVSVVLLACGLNQPARAAAAMCVNGVFDVKAQVVFIDPADGVPTKRAINGQETDLELNGVLCSGESISLPANGKVRQIVIYQAGKNVLVRAGDPPFKVKSGILAYAGRALAFADGLLGAAGELGAPPDIAVDTTSRSSLSELSAAPWLGADLPPQRLTRDLAAIVMWDGGSGPFTCSVQSKRAKILWKRKSERVRWCELRSSLTGSSRLVVHDAAGHSLSWTIARAPWSDVPRPEWISVAQSSVPPADRTAWALWLWTTAGPEWRLQALSMLNDLARSEFLARYARDSILAGTEEFAPSTRGRR
jgi:hypothetical protein